MYTVRAKMIAVGLLGAAAIVPVDFAKADQRGNASWYSLPANKTASGERMNPNELTAAHRSLPFGTRVLVENLSNGRSVVVRINDRGPFVGGRIIDLSKAAAASIGMIGAGVADVRVTVADGGMLADLGNATAKANATSRFKSDSRDAAQPDQAPASSAKMAANDAEAIKAPAKALLAKLPAKTSAKSKVAAKPAKAKSLATASLAAAKKRATAQTVKLAAAKRSYPTDKAKARVQLVAATAGIGAAGREASRLSSRRTIVASAGLREAGREASRLASRRISVAANVPHPYPVLGATPGFMKPARMSERRATG